MPRDRRDETLKRLGIERIETCTPQLAEAFDVDYRPGVLVESLVPGSSLRDTLPVGSVIVAVMDFAVGDREEFFGLLERFDLRDTRGVRIRIIRPDGELGEVLLRLDG